MSAALMSRATWVSGDPRNKHGLPAAKAVYAFDGTHVPVASSLNVQVRRRKESRQIAVCDRIDEPDSRKGLRPRLEPIDLGSSTHDQHDEVVATRKLVDSADETTQGVVVTSVAGVEHHELLRCDAETFSHVNG
jgi:hypothetical protein